MIKPEIRRFHSPDAPFLDSYVTPANGLFVVLIQMFIGAENGEGEESFDVVVCSSSWIERKCAVDPMFCEQMIVARSFDWPKIRKLLEQRVATVHGETWPDVARQLERIGRWEFSGYVADAASEP
jgi:hypothetical protein